MIINNKDDLKKAVEQKLIVTAKTDDGNIYMISPLVYFTSEFFRSLENKECVEKLEG